MSHKENGGLLNAKGCNYICNWTLALGVCKLITEVGWSLQLVKLKIQFVAFDNITESARLLSVNEHLR